MSNLWPEKSDSPAGKGSKPRPYAVSLQEYGDRYDKIFSSKDGDESSTDEEE